MLFHTSIINVTTGVRGQTKRDDNANRFLDAIRRRNLTLNDEKALSSGREFCILGYCMGTGGLIRIPKYSARYKASSDKHSVVKTGSGSICILYQTDDQFL